MDIIPRRGTTKGGERVDVIRGSVLRPNIKEAIQDVCQRLDGFSVGDASYILDMVRKEIMDASVVRTSPAGQETHDRP